MMSKGITTLSLARLSNRYVLSEDPNLLYMAGTSADRDMNDQEAGKPIVIVMRVVPSRDAVG